MKKAIKPLPRVVENVLLVDDEIPFVESMARILRKHDINVFCAFNGHEALEKLEQHRTVDIVILDIRMPGMNGFQLLREIRTRHPLVEIIVLTGHATFETAIEVIKRGAFDYLMKPCHIEYLVSKIQEAAIRKRRHEQKILEARQKRLSRAPANRAASQPAT